MHGLKDNCGEGSKLTATADLEQSELELDQELVRREFPASDCTYLNTGSCGRKPATVLAAINEGWQKLNINPTYATFLDLEPMQSARAAFSRLLGVEPRQLILTQNSTQGLQLIMHSLLLEAGDELVTTNTEHGSVTSIARHLGETRGVVTKRSDADPKLGSRALCDGLLNLVTAKTRLIVVSQISSYTGWRADLSHLESEAKSRGVPVLIDGAHSMGQLAGAEIIDESSLWVGSAHKWLGGPNGTGVGYVAPEMVSRLKPVAVGDHYFDALAADAGDVTRFESGGTADVVRWYGVIKACELQEIIGAEKIRRKQFALAQYLRQELERAYQPEFRLPNLQNSLASEATALVACYWPEERVKVPDLREALWSKYKIWIQPDFLNAKPGCGIRVACHYSNNRTEVDKLLEGLGAFIAV
ncbi:aminotransferase class V-fold PLP-dependent enzyme [bacterium]|nr:aminotransferase class V-fold PLP-dependent enzyme [bacterium]MBP9809036.1 aminotransferase class V-fold PLP-dependent enzyme [bacterium]